MPIYAQINTRAAEAALRLVGGDLMVQGISDLTEALDKAEQLGLADGFTAGVAVGTQYADERNVAVNDKTHEDAFKEGYDAGYDAGYGDGYEDGEEDALSLTIVENSMPEIIYLEDLRAVEQKRDREADES